MDSYKIQAECDVCGKDIKIFFTWLRLWQTINLIAYATLLPACLK